MTNKLFLFCSICILGCSDTDELINSHALEDQPPHSMFCGPSDLESNSLYVSSIFMKSYDSSHISDFAVVETDEMGYLINLSETEYGDLEGYVNIPYSSCEDVQVTFLSEY
jgi:hypothetical protein